MKTDKTKLTLLLVFLSFFVSKAQNPFEVIEEPLP